MTSNASNGKVAIVTGAARGIGLAVAKAFLAQRYEVALLDIDAATLRQTEKALGDALALECDVADAHQVKTSIDRVTARFGRIDALVNNAGVSVAYRAKPVVRAHATHALNYAGLDGALNLFN